MSITIPPVHLPRELEEHLAGLDDKARQEANDYMVEALEDYLFEREHGDRIKTELEAIKRGEVETVSFEELCRNLDLDPDEITAEAKAEANRA